MLRCRYQKDTGELLYTREMPHTQLTAAYGLSPAMLGWSDITATLKESLPADAVTTGVTISRYSQQPDGTLLLYNTPSTTTTSSSSSSGEGAATPTGTGDAEEPIAQCRMLIGADGWFSRIRQQLIGDGPPSFKNSVVWRARTKRPEWMPANDTKWFVPAANVHAGSILAVLIPVPGDELVWQCHSPLDILAEKGVDFDPVVGEAASSHGEAKATTTTSSSSGVGSGKSSDMIKERCLKVFSSFPEEFSNILASTPAAAITEHGLYQRAPEQIPLSNWGSGPVTLVGDAAHTAFVDGTGMGLSFEDAAVLGLKVKELGLGEAALRAYEEERGQRVRAVFEMQARHGRMVPAGEATQQELVAERNALLLGVEFQGLKGEKEELQGGEGGQQQVQANKVVSPA